MGKLQRELRKGQYHMFRSAPIFESDFVQITKHGKLTDMHNRGHFVTVGVTCTSPILRIPDVMLLAQQAASCEQCHSQAPKRKNCKAEEPLELTRLIPLKFVQISVHDREKQQLRLKLATGRSFYLQLCPPLDAREDLFTCWERLIYLLQLPFESNSGTYATPPEDILCLPELADADSSSLATSDTHGRDDWGQVSIRNIYAVAELAAATSAAHASGEGDQPSSRTSAATPKVCTPETRSAGPAEASAPGTEREAAAAGVASGMPSVDSGPVNTALAEAAFIGEGESKSPVAGPGGAEAGQQGAPRASKASGKEHRERKERREDRPLSRSSYHHRTREGHHRTREGHHRTREGHHRTREGHHRTREGRHKTEGDKMAQKSGHRTHRVNKNEEGGHRRAKSSRHHHSPLEKESRSKKKSRRSSSAVSSESTPKRLSWLNSFLRNFRANLGMKGAASLHGGNVDTVPKRVKETDLEAKVEMAECGQGVEVGSVTPEVMKTSEDLFRSP